jgi:hypothetical protein
MSTAYWNWVRAGDFLDTLYARQGRENLHGGVRTGRPPTELRDIQILVLMDADPFHAAYFIADALGFPILLYWVIFVNHLAWKCHT